MVMIDSPLWNKDSVDSPLRKNVSLDSITFVKQ